jgi:hypothetical protein
VLLLLLLLLLQMKMDKSSRARYWRDCCGWLELARFVVPSEGVVFIQIVKMGVSKIQIMNLVFILLLQFSSKIELGFIDGAVGRPSFPPFLAIMS